MSGTHKRLTRLEAAATAICERCSTPADIETIARLHQRLEEMSLPAYHRRRAAELGAEADQREAAEADVRATGRTAAAVPTGPRTAQPRGTSAAVRRLCHQCRVTKNLASRISANIAAAELDLTPEDLRRQSREALAEAERLEWRGESSAAN